MQHGFKRAVIGLALATTAPLGAQDFGYAPGTARYSAQVVTKMTQAVGGHKVEDEITQRQQLTIVVGSRAGDTLSLGVTIDSATVVSLRAGSQDASQLTGLRVAGAISRVGQVYDRSIVGRDLGPAGAVVAAEFASFLPRVRRDLRIGLTWSDTTSEQVDMLGIPVARTTIVRSAVIGDTLALGERSWRVDRRATVTFAGKGTVSGQAITMTGESSSAGHLVLARSGKYIGSDLTDSVRTTFTVPATGMQISMTQEQRTRVARIP